MRAFLGAASAIRFAFVLVSLWPAGAVAATLVPFPLAPPDSTSTDIHPSLWPKGQSGVVRKADVESKVAALLAQMTLEEKVGQVIQPDIGSITLDDIRKYHFGSVLSGGNSGPGGDDRAPASQWLKAADAFYRASIDVPAGHPVIPLIWGSDAVHGNSNIIGATIFPHNIGLGAMHDHDLVREIGAITAVELRVIGGDWTFAPMIAVARDDRWGRTYESYSEEPQIVADYAAEIVKGLQGTPDDADFLIGPHVIATAKHFLGDGGTDGGIDQGDNLYGETALRDLFAPPYESAIAAGVQTVMASYSSWRGQKVHGSRALLNDVLVGRLGFDGFVVGDWNGYLQVPGCNRSSCPQVLLAGVDMYMAPDGWKGLYENTLTQARAGQIPMKRLDEAVSRILRVKYRAGVFGEGPPSGRPYAGQWNLLGSAEHRAVARRAVRESLVLLKNENQILPLSPKLQVLVAGDGADNLPKQCGGWTISWQGDSNGRADFPSGETVFEGIREAVQAAGGSAVLSPDGSFSERPDVAIVAFGEDPYAEFIGDRVNADYQSGNRRSLKLLQSLKARGLPVISIFVSGRPLYVTPEINSSDAFVAAWLPGSEGGGIADMLFRKPDTSIAFDFRGRLSFSWPRGPEQAPLNADTEPYYPLFALGYGLDYAHPRNLGVLPEAPPSVAVIANTERYLENGRSQQPWQIVLHGAGAAVIADGTSAALPNRSLRVKKTSGVLRADWKGTAPAMLALTGPKIDVARQTDAGMVLTLRLRVNNAPAGSIGIGIGCGKYCQSVIDVTDSLRTAKRGMPIRVSIPLSCFRAKGANMREIVAPLLLTSSGVSSLSIISAGLMPGDAAPACTPVVTT